MIEIPIHNIPSPVLLDTHVILSISSSAIYSSTFSNHIILSVDIISVYLKVAMHQGMVSIESTNVCCSHQ